MIQLNHILDCPYFEVITVLTDDAQAILEQVDYFEVTGPFDPINLEREIKLSEAFEGIRKPRFLVTNASKIKNGEAISTIRDNWWGLWTDQLQRGIEDAPKLLFVVPKHKVPGGAFFEKISDCVFFHNSLGVITILKNRVGDETFLESLKLKKHI